MVERMLSGNVSNTKGKITHRYCSFVLYHMKVTLFSLLKKKMEEQNFCIHIGLKAVNKKVILSRRFYITNCHTIWSGMSSSVPLAGKVMYHDSP